MDKAGTGILAYSLVSGHPRRAAFLHRLIELYVDRGDLSSCRHVFGHRAERSADSFHRQAALMRLQVPGSRVTPGASDVQSALSPGLELIFVVNSLKFKTAARGREIALFGHLIGAGLKSGRP